MPDQRAVAEGACVALFLVYLLWLPLPFGSVTDAAQPALVLPPLLICAAAAILRSRRPGEVTQPLRIWTIGAVFFALVVAFQLVPLPAVVLRVVSPESARLWSDASRIASLAGIPHSTAHPISVDPSMTAVHLFRIVAYAAIFIASALLLRRHKYRYALALVLGAGAVFQSLYGVREAVLHRYAIWGWVNNLIFDRATGTFVNPNHFAHYAAIVMPLGVYVSITAWHDAAPPGAALGHRIVRLVERRMIAFGAGLIICCACAIAILIAQSRGALVAAVGGFAIAGALASGPRHAVRRIALVVLAAGAIVTIIAVLAGTQQTVGRFSTIGDPSIGGRGRDAVAAFEIWRRFPLFGSGLGTFAGVVSMTGVGDPEVVINHAHDDYAEIIATTGAVGFVAAVVPFIAGVVALAMMTFRRGREETWTRSAFRTAALTSLAIAMLHALVDFNFFIPANPATLAAIAGAAAAVRERR